MPLPKAINQNNHKKQVIPVHYVAVFRESSRTVGQFLSAVYQKAMN